MPSTGWPAQFVIWSFTGITLPCLTMFRTPSWVKRLEGDDVVVEADDVGVQGRPAIVISDGHGQRGRHAAKSVFVEAGELARRIRLGVLDIGRHTG